MKLSVAFLALLLLSLPALRAQQPTPAADTPNVGPYFVKPGSYNPEQAIIPKEAPEDNIPNQLKGFFKDITKSVKLKNLRPVPVVTELKVDPMDVNLKEKRELAVTLIVSNHTGHLMKLDFPTSQRLEVLLRDSQGKVIERWSEDHAFEQVEGIVTVNPGERIEYAEHISTREMKPDQKYMVEASIANHPEYSRTVTVKGK
ncbi:MAG: BsuPI-related putative proteinase inhibitor [Chthoniobacterales bacterium]